MFIALEGTDCAGKTTWSQSLAKQYGAKYLHFSKPDKDPFEYFSKAFKIAEKNKVVCDRFIVGEKVYATAKQRPSEWKGKDYHKMLKQMEKMGAMLIHVWEDKKTLLQRYRDRGETYVTEKEMLLVQSLFEKAIYDIAMEYPGIMCMRYQPSKDKLQLIRYEHVRNIQ